MEIIEKQRTKKENGNDSFSFFPDFRDDMLDKVELSLISGGVEQDYDFISNDRDLHLKGSYLLRDSLEHVL